MQSQSQLKAIYKDNADTIVGNCDTTLFLGGKEKTTLKEISEILGKETIDSFNTSETRGRELSHGYLKQLMVYFSHQYTFKYINDTLKSLIYINASYLNIIFRVQLCLNDVVNSAVCSL